MVAQLAQAPRNRPLIAMIILTTNNNHSSALIVFAECCQGTVRAADLEALCSILTLHFNPKC